MGPPVHQDVDAGAEEHAGSDQDGDVPGRQQDEHGHDAQHRGHPDSRPELDLDGRERGDQEHQPERQHRIRSGEPAPSATSARATAT